MGKSSKLIKSLILGAKAFSRDQSGDKKEQSNKIRSHWSLGKAYSCGYDPDDDNEDQQDSKSNERIGHGIAEGGFAPVVMYSDPQSETTVANGNSESGLSVSVVKPDNAEVSAEEQVAVPGTNVELSIEENAAIAIQAAFKGFLCRRAFRALKDATRFQDLADGQIVKEQTAMGSRCMQALIKVQARVRARQVQMSEEGKAVQKQIQQKRRLQAYNAKSPEDWEHSLATFGELQAKLQNKKDASMRRERALAYAFSQQLRICGQRNSQQAVGEAVGDCVHSDQQPHLGWTWLERWMAARSLDSNTELETDIRKNHYLIMDVNNKQNHTTAPHQYGKIKRYKKTIDKQPILSPTRSLPYNNPTAMKSTPPSLAKSSLSRTPAISTGSSSHESPHNKFGKRHSTDILIERPTYPEKGHRHHHASYKKQLSFADENNKDDVSQAEESCGSKVICSNPELKAKADSSSSQSSRHDHPKLRHNSSSGNGPAELRIRNYMSTTQSSKAKVHRSDDPTKPKPQPVTPKSTLAFVSSSDLSM